jgi:predicted enzyme related to lactoylglutathione lyase
MTTDAKKAQQFYCALFDWQIQEMPIGPGVYRMIVCGPGPIGGMREEKSMAGSSWLPYVAVDDVDAMVGKITQRKGTVRVPPTDLPETGRYAIVADPVGAAFAVYRGKPNWPGFDPDLPVPGRACWNELLSPDDKAAQAFYSAVFGWKEDPMDMGAMGVYRRQMLGDKQVGGMMKNPGGGAPNAWLVYFLAPDLSGSTQKAKQLGAKALIENVPIPNIGAFSMFVDPVSAPFAMFCPDTPKSGKK